MDLSKGPLVDDVTSTITDGNEFSIASCVHHHLSSLPSHLTELTLDFVDVTS